MEVIEPHLETIGAALRIAARRRSERHLRRSRRVTMVAVAAPFVLGGGSALAGVAGVGPFADQLAVFTSSATPAESTIPASVSEIAHQEAEVSPSQGTPDTTSARKIAGAPNGAATLHAMRSGNRVCFTLAGGTGAIGHCIAQLSANDEMEASLGIVDSQAYVWGAIANDVTRVSVSTAGGDIDATIGENGFVVPVTQAQAQCRITVTVTSPAGMTHQVLQPVPSPAGGVSAPGKNGLQSGRMTHADC